jgi:hypothetical protein
MLNKKIYNKYKKKRERNEGEEKNCKKRING